MSTPILPQNAPTVQHFQIKIPTNCYKCAFWNPSDRTPNVGNCTYLDAKTLGTDHPREICHLAFPEPEDGIKTEYLFEKDRYSKAAEDLNGTEYLSETNRYSKDSNTYAAKSVAPTYSLSIPSETEYLSDLNRYSITHPMVEEAITHLESAISKISQTILLLQDNSLPGFVTQYERPGRKNPGHNHCWHEDGKRRQKHIPLVQVGLYREMCSRGAEIKRLRQRSCELEKRVYLLKNGGVV